MNWQHLLFFGALVSLSTASNAQAQSSYYFSGFYGGFEVGAISYNTQITFEASMTLQVEAAQGTAHALGTTTPTKSCWFALNCYSIWPRMQTHIRLILPWWDLPNWIYGEAPVSALMSGLVIL